VFLVSTILTLSVTMSCVYVIGDLRHFLGGGPRN